MSLTSNFRSASVTRMEGYCTRREDRFASAACCMPHTGYPHGRIFPGFVVVERIGPGREINCPGYEPGRLSLYFCVARKDARPVDVYARVLPRTFCRPSWDTNNNPKISGAQALKPHESEVLSCTPTAMSTRVIFRVLFNFLKLHNISTAVPKGSYKLNFL